MVGSGGEPLLLLLQLRIYEANVHDHNVDVRDFASTTLLTITNSKTETRVDNVQIPKTNVGQLSMRAVRPFRKI